jgi:peroxiredoxin
MKEIETLINKAFKYKESGLTEHEIAEELNVSKETAVWLLSKGKEKKPESALAPDFNLKTLDGKEIALSQFKGKVILLDFWATWCGPCVGELPHLQDLHRALKGRDNVLMLSISLDREEKALRAFLEKQHMPWLHVFGDKGGAAAAAEAFPHARAWWRGPRISGKKRVSVSSW